MPLKSRKVLIPTDGSENSLRAIRYVLRRGGSDRPVSIVVLNVQPRMPVGSVVSKTMVDQHYARQSEAALAPARKRLARRKQNIEFRVLVGDPAPTIVEAARRWRCSEVVMGTRGLSALKGLLLGSVAMKAIQLSSVPVTVVP